MRDRIGPVARVGPTLAAREGVQGCWRPLADRPFAPLQDDRVIPQRWRRALERAAGRHALNVHAGGRESEIAPAQHRFHGARRIELPTSLKDADLVARPPRSAVAEARLHVAQVRAGVAPFLSAGLAPERQPLTGMAVTDGLHSAHHPEDDRPE